MRLAISPVIERTANPVIVTRNVTLLKGDVYCLPREYRDLWVVSGRAWVTVNGEDIVLNKGDRASFEKNTDAVVITSVGTAPLVLEIPGR